MSLAQRIGQEFKTLRDNELTLKFDKANIENILTSVSTTNALSAAQGKVLKDSIDSISTLLSSNDVDLDTLQEIVAFIKANKGTLDSLGIDSIIGLQTALNSKVDDSRVLTDVPSGAVFTDTTYSVGDGGLTEKNFTSTLKTKLDAITGTNTGDQDLSGYSLTTHNHTGTYEPADTTILKDADIGSTVQAYNSNTTTAGNTFNGVSQLVQTTVDGKLPAIDGSLLTGIATGSEHYSQELTPTGMSIGATWYVPSTSKTYMYVNDGTNNIWIDTSPVNTGVTKEYVDTGLAGKVDDAQVLTNVPVGALFTDTVYTHPTTDGSLHVPATSTTNEGKVLTAGATAGSLSWTIPSATDATKLPLAGGNLTGAINNTQVDKGTVSTGTVTFTQSAGNVQRLQVGGALTIAVSGWATTGIFSDILLRLVNAGSATVTLPTINWIKSDGTLTTTFATYLTAIARPALQTSGVDFMYLFTLDGGTTLYGKLL